MQAVVSRRAAEKADLGALLQARRRQLSEVTAERDAAKTQVIEAEIQGHEKREAVEGEKEKAREELAAVEAKAKQLEVKAKEDEEKIKRQQEEMEKLQVSKVTLMIVQCGV